MHQKLSSFVSSRRQTSVQPGSKKQRGFTMVELVVVIAIIGLLIFALTTGLFQSKEDAKVQAVKTQLLKDFPSSITRLVTMANKCTSTNVTFAKMVERGAPALTVFATTWTVAVTGANTVTVTYPLDLQDAALATDLRDSLVGGPNVKTVTGTATQIVVAYRCN